MSLTGMLISPSFAPEMRISASYPESAPIARSPSAQQQRFRPSCSTCHLSQQQRPEPYVGRSAHSSRSSSSSSLVQPTESSPRAGYSLAGSETGRVLPGLESLLRDNPKKRLLLSHSSEATEHAIAPATHPQVSSVAHPTSWDKADQQQQLQSELFSSEQRSNEGLKPIQPAAPKIGSLDEGRFESVMSLYEPEEPLVHASSWSVAPPPYPYPSSYSSSTFAPLPALGLISKQTSQASTSTSSYPLTTGLSGLGLTFDQPSGWSASERYRSSNPPETMYNVVHHQPLPLLNVHSPGSVLMPATSTTTTHPTDPGTVPTTLSLSTVPPAPTDSQGSTPTSNQIHLTAASPLTSTGSTLLPSPSTTESELISPLTASTMLSVDSLDQSSNSTTTTTLNRSFSVAQTAILNQSLPQSATTAPANPSTSGGFSGSPSTVAESKADGNSSFRQRSKARSAALVQRTATAFHAYHQAHHQGRSRRTTSSHRPSTIPAVPPTSPPEEQDSPWGIFSLHPKKIGTWKPLFPPGIRPPVPPGTQKDKGAEHNYDLPSPLKRARTAKADKQAKPANPAKQPKGAATTTSKGSTRAQQSKKATLAAKANGKPTKGKPTLSAKIPNQVGL